MAAKFDAKGRKPGDSVPLDEVDMSVFDKFDSLEIDLIRQSLLSPEEREAEQRIEGAARLKLAHASRHLRDRDTGMLEDYDPDALAAYSSVQEASTLPFAPGVLGELTKILLKSSKKPSRPLATMSVTALVSAAMGTAYVYVDKVDGTVTHLAFYGMGIGKTGAGKGTMKRGINGFRTLLKKNQIPPNFIIESKFASEPGFHDTLIACPNPLVLVDEFGAKLEEAKHNQHWQNVLTMLLELYSEDELPGRKYGDKSKNKDAVEDHKVTFVSALQTKALQDAVTARSITGGLMARFVYFDQSKKVNKIPRHLKTKIHMPPDIVDWFKGLIEHVINVGLPGQFEPEFPCDDGLDWKFAVRADDEADALLQKLEAYYDDKTDEEGELSDLYNRANENIIRLASIAAVADSDPMLDELRDPVMTVEHVGWASSVVHVGLNAVSKVLKDNVADTTFQRRYNTVKNAILRATLNNQKQLLNTGNRARKLRYALHTDVINNCKNMSVFEFKCVLAKMYEEEILEVFHESKKDGVTELTDMMAQFPRGVYYRVTKT